MKDCRQGEAVLFTEDYDLFHTNVKDCEAMFYKYSTIEGKCLVYVPMVEEWAEPELSTLKQKKPGHVPRKYANLCKRIEELKITA